MDKPLFDGYYQFILHYTAEPPYGKWEIELLRKFGEHPILDELFVRSENTHAYYDGEDEYGHYFFFSKDHTRHLVIETSVERDPYGKDATPYSFRSDDCFLFQCSEENVWEIFVSKGNGHRTLELYDLMIMGCIWEEMLDVADESEPIVKTSVTLNIKSGGEDEH